MLDGMRIDPPPSPACATGTIPLATAAAEPPLDPPELRVVSHGLRVGAVRLRFGGRHQAELGRVRLPDDDEPGALELLEEVARRGRGVVRRSAATRLPAWYGVARERAVEVLDDDRDAAERPVGKVGGRGVARPVEQRMDDRVQLAVELLDAR